MSMLCTCIRGQMSNAFFNRGANVHPCQSLGGQMSLYTIFRRGGQMSEGGNVLHSHSSYLDGSTPLCDGDHSTTGCNTPKNAR